ncbi:hypothetical protein L1887_30361 [Cichorium endivia]|nr:hypothetical protein L1887_30361 [Cichorium endivia]
MCSVTQFLKEIEESGKKEIIEKWTDDDSPFLSLLNMENCILVKSDVAAKLLKMCDPGNHTININGNVYTITTADFVETMGIKSGTDKFGDLQNVQSGELFDKFCAYEKGDEKLPYICRKKVTDRLKIWAVELGQIPTRGPTSKNNNAGYPRSWQFAFDGC